jgi:RNA polymerase sigma-70 factor (ECF subfamily)
VPPATPEPPDPDPTAAGSDAVTPDEASRAWLDRLRSDDRLVRERAVADLHDLLVRAARHEGERRRASLPTHVAADLGQLAEQAANEAVVVILRKLDAYRGASRFTTWAWKFAIFEMSAALRREAWRGRSVAVDEASWDRMADRAASEPERVVEFRDLIDEVRRFVATELTPRQRDVFVAVVIEEVPMDVLAARLGSTRGAIYKTLFDARARLRARFGSVAGGGTMVERASR